MASMYSTKLKGYKYKNSILLAGKFLTSLRVNLNRETVVIT